MKEQWAVMWQFKRRFFVKRDPAEQDNVPMIPLKRGRGKIQVHGPDRLGAVVRHKYVPTFARKLHAEFPGVEVLEGDGELLVTWPIDTPWCVELMDWLGARRRRRLSTDERERSRQLGLKYRHNLRSNGQRSSPESHEAEISGSRPRQTETELVPATKKG